MNRIEAVIFDCEGVVIDSEGIWDQVAEEFLGRRGFVYDRTTIKPLMMGRTLIEGVRIWQGHYGFGGDPEEQTQERRGIAKKFFETEIAFVPGFLEFYRTLQGKYKVAMATSLERGFLNAVDRGKNLSSLFNGHLYSIADIGNVSKPNPDIYLYAASKLGVHPSRCIGIEDAPHGVESLKRAGMKSIGIATSTTRERLSKAHFVVDSYQEIERLFKTF